MNKYVVFGAVVALSFFQVNAQRKANYFGKKFFVGWEHPVRVFGFANEKLSGDGFGMGKFKIEKLTRENKSIGFSYGKDNYLIHDERMTSYGSSVGGSQRHLKAENYTFFKKWYRKSRGIAPIGSYSLFGLTYNRLSIKEKSLASESQVFGYFAAGFHMGRSFPILGTKLIGNISLGLDFTLNATGYSSGSNYNQYSNDDVYQAHFGMNILRANLGISYALF